MAFERYPARFDILHRPAIVGELFSAALIFIQDYVCTFFLAACTHIRAFPGRHMDQMLAACVPAEPHLRMAAGAALNHVQPADFATGFMQARRSLPDMIRNCGFAKLALPLTDATLFL
nr:hypothetical protein [Roseobacter sp.]